ncbi:hypothetical protein SUGI_0353990 [Cryptomeria japonica]|uniref:transcription factor GTE6 n=1 Tax=Cryptomeria japonica TaxID=3369 RepID=UPI002408A822|nr:transcription factor GTE6 [Cryptomeria japonica]XP_057819966.2 transcription factor GTE6 [Cryptomeria japonica]XP_057819968.2 transcription factor GTE6 [Cryptomeria japonica]XP_057819969.2 transcription factor GTE6 [Cryptomeria japonica]XP_057819970.2 transcription factor GTE6 [Cryptomeria japonica]XP_059075570.1 transcription factor GTE6 [Cryptomeria japonica]GLJ19579.1 hypothetical protein SUGI_0353990 [Cryptomeria japonica]
MDLAIVDSAKEPTIQDVQGEGIEDKAEDENVEKERLRQEVDIMSSKVEKLEQKVNEVARLHILSSKDKSQQPRSDLAPRDKERERISLSNRKQHEASCREAACTKRMAELMRQFGTILRQITSDRWAWPFVTPVDVKGLGLHDYHEVIEKPMDLGTIKRQMDAKDGTSYNNVRDICEDVRLVFKNAMTYNDETHDVYVMAKTLSQKFEKKWNAFLPKVVEEETKRKQEEGDGNLRENSGIQVAQEAAAEKIASEISYELDELNARLEELRQKVSPKCRMMSTEEKRQLGSSLGQLPPEDLTKALQIIAQTNPNFKPTEVEVEVDIDAQDAPTLWRLQYFVKAVLGLQEKNSTAKVQAKTKRKREICDAVEKNVQKRSRKALP